MIEAKPYRPIPLYIRTILLSVVTIVLQSLCNAQMFDRVDVVNLLIGATGSAGMKNYKGVPAGRIIPKYGGLDSDDPGKRKSGPILIGIA